MNNEIKDFFSRHGFVKIRRKLIKSNPELVKRMQCHLLIMDANYNFTEDTITYWGCSKEFEPVSEQIKAPEYISVFEDNQFLGFKRKKINNEY